MMTKKEKLIKKINDLISPDTIEETATTKELQAFYERLTAEPKTPPPPAPPAPPAPPSPAPKSTADSGNPRWEAVKARHLEQKK